MSLMTFNFQSSCLPATPKSPSSCRTSPGGPAILRLREEIQGALALHGTFGNHTDWLRK